MKSWQVYAILVVIILSGLLLTYINKDTWIPISTNSSFSQSTTVEESLNQGAGTVLISSGSYVGDQYQCMIDNPEHWDNLVYCNIKVSRTCNDYTCQKLWLDKKPNNVAGIVIPSTSKDSVERYSGCSSYGAVSVGGVNYEYMKGKYYHCDPYSYTTKDTYNLDTHNLNSYSGIHAGTQASEWTTNLPNGVYVMANNVPDSTINYEKYGNVGCEHYLLCTVNHAAYCKDGDLYICDDDLAPNYPGCGEERLDTDCVFGCSYGECTCPSTQCSTEGQFVCNSDTSDPRDYHVCRKLNGCLFEDQNVNYCEGNEICRDGKCVVDCSQVPSSLRCDGNVGAVRCNNNNREVCLDSQGCATWSIEEKCGNVKTCSVTGTSTECKCPAVIGGNTEGDACDPSTFNASCDEYGRAVSCKTDAVSGCSIVVKDTCNAPAKCYAGSCMDVKLDTSLNKDIFSPEDEVKLTVSLNTGVSNQEVQLFVDGIMYNKIAPFTTTYNLGNYDMGQHTISVSVPKFDLYKTVSFQVTRDFSVYITPPDYIYAGNDATILIKTFIGSNPVDATVNAYGVMNGKRINPGVKFGGIGVTQLLFQGSHLKVGTLKIVATALDTDSGYQKTVSKSFSVKQPELSAQFDIASHEELEVGNYEKLDLDLEFLKSPIDGADCTFNYQEPGGSSYSKQMVNDGNGKYVTYFTFDTPGLYTVYFECTKSPFRIARAPSTGTYSITVSNAPNQKYCGDGACNNGETKETCPDDCAQSSSQGWLWYAIGIPLVLLIFGLIIFKTRKRR